MFTKAGHASAHARGQPAAAASLPAASFRCLQGAALRASGQRAPPPLVGFTLPGGTLPWARCAHIIVASVQKPAATEGNASAGAGVPEAWRPAVVLWKAANWSEIDTVWQRRYWELVEYAHIKGKAPPYASTGLGRWVKNQSQNRVRLPPVLRELLLAVPGWRVTLTPPPVLDTDFQTTCDAYEAMAQQKGGRPLVQTNATKAEKDLADWLVDMKAYGMYHEGALTRQQRARLEALPGFKWEFRNLAPKGPNGMPGPNLPFFSLQ